MDLKEDGRGVLRISRTSQHGVEIRENFLNVIIEVGITVDRLKAGIAGRSKHFLSVSSKQHVSYLLDHWGPFQGIYRQLL